MRRLLLASILALAPVAVMAASLGVPLNQSVLVSLPGPAHNVFLGNPDVADVAMSDQRHIVLTGKKGGVTNLIVTDARGRTIFNRQLVVGVNGGDRVALINGGAVVSYACAPICEQTGDPQNPPSGSAMPSSGPTPTYNNAAPSAAPAGAGAPAPLIGH